MLSTFFLRYGCNGLPVLQRARKSTYSKNNRYVKEISAHTDLPMQKFIISILNGFYLLMVELSYNMQKEGTSIAYLQSKYKVQFRQILVGAGLLWLYSGVGLPEPDREYRFYAKCNIQQHDDTGVTKCTANPTAITLHPISLLVNVYVYNILLN